MVNASNRTLFDGPGPLFKRLRYLLIIELFIIVYYLVLLGNKIDQ